MTIKHINRKMNLHQCICNLQVIVGYVTYFPNKALQSNLQFDLTKEKRSVYSQTARATAGCNLQAQLNN